MRGEARHAGKDSWTAARGAALLSEQADVELSDASVIKLRPCRFWNGDIGTFKIVRHRGMNLVTVRAGDVEACMRFHDGCSIREVKQHLAQRDQMAVDLGRLLRSLQNADLIGSVDGRPVREVRPPSLYSAYRYYLRFHFKRKLLRIAHQKLPLALGKRLAHWTHRLDLAATLWPKAVQAEQHVRRSPAISRSAGQSFATRYFRHLIQNIVDFESLEAMPPSLAERWYQENVEYEGLEHLARAKAAGQPVIVAGFQFSTAKLLVRLLMRRGYDATHLRLPDGCETLASSARRIAELSLTRPDYGKLQILSDFSFPSYKRILKSLRNGGLFVWFADLSGSQQDPTGEWTKGDSALNDSTTGDFPAAEIFNFGQLRTDLEQAKLDVMLCGQQVYLNPWIGGLARITGATVIPAAVVREDERLRMILRPALRLPANATHAHSEELNRALFRQLDALLREYPDQWCGWHSLCPVSGTNH